VPKPLLLVIDAQQGFRDENYWGKAANPSALENIQKLVEFFRVKELPVALVKHNSKNPNSPLHSGSPGNQLEAFLEGVREVLIQKSVNSAFYGSPDLQHWLTDRGYRRLIICGITTNFCCETTARMAGNLGYEVDFVIDATSAFDAKSPEGEPIPGKLVMQMTATNLNGEFAKVTSTAELLDQLDSEL
jgi:nicotinamidase-related amidase